MNYFSWSEFQSRSISWIDSWRNTAAFLKEWLRRVKIIGLHSEILLKALVFGSVKLILPNNESNEDHFCSWMWRNIHEFSGQIELNTFSPTSPAKYCFCPKHFLAYVWLVYQGTREG